MKITYALIIALGFPLSQAWAQQAEDPAAVAQAELNCSQSVTVFQDVFAAGRKDRAARNISRRHDEMAMSGWVFADMEIYSENGDLEGFFLTYKRIVSCASAEHD